MSDLDNIIKLVKGKDVFLGTHWDADGIASGSLLFHLVKPHAKSIKTISKGKTFQIEKVDLKGNPDVVICTDIHASDEIDPKKVIYIDHHPCSDVDKYLYAIHDEQCQSCSLLIWQKLLSETKNPYFIFLTLIGYFGDGGDREAIPAELHIRANDLLKVETKFGLHDLMEKKNSRFNNEGYYYEIERFVSALNTGKRMNWSGDVPFELMKNIDHFKPFIYNFHPIAETLQEYRRELRNYYGMQIKLFDTKQIQYAMIECDKNVQGVLCARYMKDKPLLVLNKYDGHIIGSMRVPDHIDFDAGSFLGGFIDKVPTAIGGGHEKAGGITFDIEHMDMFLDLLSEC